MPVSTGYRATWGSRHTKLIQELDLDTRRINFQFPNMGGRNGADIHEDPNIKSQRSKSEPNIPQTKQLSIQNVLSLYRSPKWKKSKI